MKASEFIDDIEKRLHGRIVVGPMDDSNPPKMPTCYASVASNEEIKRLIELIRNMEEELDILNER